MRERERERERERLGFGGIAVSVSFRILMKRGQKYVNSNFWGGGHAIGTQSAL